MGLSKVDPNAFMSVPAVEALVGKKEVFVKLNTDGEAELCGEGEAGYVLSEAATEAGNGTIVLGEWRQAVEAGGAVAVGDLVMSNADGKAVAATAEHTVLGIALEAGASGDIISILTAAPVYTIPAA